MRTVGEMLASVAVLGGLLPGAPLAAQAVAGRVVDGAQRPVVGAPVRLLRAAPRDTGVAADTTPLASGVTAADGAFMLLTPGPGTYRARIGDAFLTPPATLASADSVDMREYRLVVPAPPSAVAIGPHEVADSSGCRGGVRCPFQVEKQAAAVPGTVIARYPNVLQGRGTAGDGRVVVQFVVDTAGRAEPQTLRVLEASDPAFVPEVQAAVARARFYPAEVAHRPVRQLVQLPFTFTLAPDAKPYVPPPLFGPPFKPLPAATGSP